MIIAILVWSDVIKATSHLSLDNIETGSQQFLICIEMFLAAMAHRWAFAHTEFADKDLEASQSWSQMFCILFDYSELVENVSLLPGDVDCVDR